MRELVERERLPDAAAKLVNGILGRIQREAA